MHSRALLTAREKCTKFKSGLERAKDHQIMGKIVSELFNGNIVKAIVQDYEWDLERGLQGRKKLIYRYTK